MKDIKQRTKDFSLRIIRLFSSLPESTTAQVIGKQLLRSGTSVGAHYREATRARSTKEFVSKLGGAQEELEETAYWLELLTEAGILASAKLRDLQNETDEIGKFLLPVSRTPNKKNSLPSSLKIRKFSLKPYALILT